MILAVFLVKSNPSKSITLKDIKGSILFEGKIQDVPFGLYTYDIFHSKLKDNTLWLSGPSVVLVPNIKQRGRRRPMTIKTLDGVKKLLETRILEYKEEIKSENVRNDRDLHSMVDGEIFALADLYIDIFGKEAFEELIKESKI